MGLLNNRDFDLSAFDGPFGPVLFRSPLQGDGSVGFGPAAASDPTQAGGAFDGVAVPFGFAGPGSLNFNPPVDPTIQNLHTVAVPVVSNRQSEQSIAPSEGNTGSKTIGLGEALHRLWENPPSNGFVHILKTSGRAIRNIIEAERALEALRNAPAPQTEEEAATQNELSDRANAQLINGSAEAALRFGPMAPGSAAVSFASRQAARVAPLAILGAVSTSQKPQGNSPKDR